LRDSGCLAVSFCIEIYATGVIFGKGFNPLCPVLGVLSFFFCTSRSSPQTGVFWKCYPLQVSYCDVDYLFPPLSEGAGIPALSWGSRDSPAVTVGSTGSLRTEGGKPPSTCSEVDCHSVEELEFQLLDRRDRTVLQGGKENALDLCAPWRSRPFGAAYRIASYSFPPSVGNMVFHSLIKEQGGLSCCQAQ
jgi:hypothetical protein